jgi:DNA-binding CsgD family transcriptional regulator
MSVLGENGSNPRVLKALSAAIDNIGTPSHVDRLIDLIGTLVPHDRVTVVRYSVTEKPEFVSWRNYSEAMVRKYLDTYYVYDPFYAQWRARQKPGVVRLDGKAREPYIAEFLGQSDISDEVGVLLQDGPGWCLGIFLDRKRGRFSETDVKRLKDRFDVFGSLHALDIKNRSPGFKRTSQPLQAGGEPLRSGTIRIAPDLWPALSVREREIAQLILMGHPTAGIAAKLKLSPGTVKNHRRNIYGKLDITTERELFLQYIDRQVAGA